MNRLFPLLVVLVLCIVPTHAQDTSPPNFPPDPADLFDPRLQLVDVELIPPIPYTDDVLQQAFIYDLDAQTYQSFPFPAQIDELTGITPWENGKYLLVERLRRAWIIDPRTGTITPHDMVCDNLIPAPPAQGKWVALIGWDTQAGVQLDVRLCNTATGEITPPLPDDIDWYFPYPFPPVEVATSPDSNWLVLIASEGEGTFGRDTYTPLAYAFYSYEIATGEVLRIGEVPIRLNMDTDINMPTIGGWVDDTHALVVHTLLGESAPNDFYNFDVTQAGSLSLFLQGWLQRSTRVYIDYNRSYQTLETSAQLQFITGSHFEFHQPCILSIYDTHGFRQFELGYDCLAAHFFYADGAYYTVRADANPSATSTLIRVDSLTGEITELFTGEIEGFVQLSPDGRYATLMMDDNGQVDRVDVYLNAPRGGAQDPYELESPYFVTIDTQSGQVIETSTDADRFRYDYSNPFEYLLSPNANKYAVRMTQIGETTFTAEVTPRYYNGYSPPRAIYTLEYQSD